MNQLAAPVPRLARHQDLPMIVKLPADDPLGATRETVADPLPSAYSVAFDEIVAHRAGSSRHGQ